MTSIVSPASKVASKSEDRQQLRILSTSASKYGCAWPRFIQSQQSEVSSSASKQDVSSPIHYQHQRRPRPPLSGLPLSINKIYRRMYASESNYLVGVPSTDGQSPSSGGVILRQYIIPCNPRSRLYQSYKRDSNDKSGLIPWSVGSPLSMGAFLDKPRTEKSNESGQGAGLRFGIAAMQGWRIEMEDSHTARAGTDLPAPWTDWAFFAVFDGHAGAKVSKYCATHLLESIWHTPEMQELAQQLPVSKLENKQLEAIMRAMKHGFLSLDEKMRLLPELHGENERSGSTAVCVVVSPSHLFVGNLGDSRALISRNGQVHFATEDHKPYLPKERDRIVNAGGSVMIQRVNGSLAVSRALGDYEYKSVPNLGPCQQLVSPEPDVHVIERDLLQSEAGRDEFLLLACDGVFDVMNNHELCDFVRSRLRVTDRLELICNQILDSCLSKGSKDNMSIILVTFPGAPQVSNEAVDKERELEARLRERIHGIVNVCDHEIERDEVDADYVLRLLMNQEIPGVPPGAGLHAMRPLVESILDSMMVNSVSSNKSAPSSVDVGTPRQQQHQASFSPSRSSPSPAPLSSLSPSSPSQPPLPTSAVPVSGSASSASSSTASSPGDAPALLKTITAPAQSPLADECPKKEKS